MALMEFSINPLGTGTASVSPYVARAVKVVEKGRGLKYSVTPMGTIVEGELEKLLALIPRVHEAVFAAGVSRIVTIVKIDDRRDKPLTREGKVRSVKKMLNRPHGN